MPGGLPARRYCVHQRPSAAALPMVLTVREAASSPSIILEAARLTFPFAVGEGVFEVKALTRDITFPTYFRCCARPCLDDCQWNITYCVPARPIVAKSEWYNDFNRERH